MPDVLMRQVVGKVVETFYDELCGTTCTLCHHSACDRATERQDKSHAKTG